MSNNFKEIYPYNLFIKFLQQNFKYFKNYFFIDIFAYKRCKYNNNIGEFIESLKPYYRDNKLFYLERKYIFKNFATIIRQLCKLYNIKYDTSVKYIHNSYQINYYIYIDITNIDNI